MDTGHNIPSAMPQRQWTPASASDCLLLDTSKSFYLGSEDGDDDKKRMGNKEISFTSGLYPGRQTHKGEGHSGTLEVAGEGDTASSKGQGQRSISQMSQIDEEQNQELLGESSSWPGNYGTDSVSMEKQDTDSWADRVSYVHNRVDTAESGFTSNITGGYDEHADIINVAIDEKISDRSEVSSKKPPRPSSAGARLLSGRSRQSSGKTGVTRPQSGGQARPNSEKTHSSSSSCVSAKPRSRRPSVISIQRLNPAEPPTEEVRYYTPYKRPSVTSVSRISPRQDRRRSLPGHDVTRQQEKGRALMSVPSLDETHEQMMQRTYHNSPDLQEEEAGDDADYNNTHYKDLDQYSDHDVEGNEDHEMVAEEDILHNILECNREIQQIEALAEKVQDEAEHSDSESSMDEATIREVLGVKDAYREPETETGEAEGGENIGNNEILDDIAEAGQQDEDEHVDLVTDRDGEGLWGFFSLVLGNIYALWD